MNMTGPIANGELAEMDDLIRQLTVIRSEMLELESSMMVEIGELHAAYRDSAQSSSLFGSAEARRSSPSREADQTRPLVTGPSRVVCIRWYGGSLEGARSPDGPSLGLAALVSRLSALPGTSCCWKAHPRATRAGACQPERPHYGYHAQ